MHHTLSMKKKSQIQTFIILLFLLLLPNTVPAEDVIDDPLIHSVVNNDIRTIMHDLDRLMMKKSMSSLMIMEMQVDYLQKLVLNADRLSYAAQEINEAIPGVKMTNESQATFKALAKQLVDEADNLRFLAEDMQLNELDDAYQKIHTTCAACHLLFRDEELRTH